jgi:hypothetical protein
MQAMPCNHCKQPRCRLCYLYAHDARYRALWGGDPADVRRQLFNSPAPGAGVTPPQHKPRMSVDELARKRRRCGELRSAGLPCNEFAPPPAGRGHSQAGQTTEVRGGPQGEDEVRRIEWAYGITTVPARRNTLLPRTVESLKTAGFPTPVLFIDGATHDDATSYEREFGVPCVPRWPVIRTFGNWVLGLAELYIRNPGCSHYVMFQDDLVCSRNLRQYLERCEYPSGERGRPKGYWNLYTFDFYWRRAPRDQTVRREIKDGWFQSPTGQGLGAVGLVFNRNAVVDLLTERGHVVTRPSHPGDRSWRNIDGGIVDALGKYGWREMVHNPSLVQHTGVKSVMGSQRHPDARSFRGEDFDCLSLLPQGANTPPAAP